MSDVRRIRLDSEPAQNIKAVSSEGYKLGQSRQNELRDLLPGFEKLDYWDPRYQAVEPFLMTYLRSGVAPDLAGQWLPRLSAKIEELMPPKSKFHNIFSEVVRMNRATDTVCFEQYTWNEVEEFTDFICGYIDNRKALLKMFYDYQLYDRVMLDMLAVPENHVIGDVASATYLYRHCMMDDSNYIAMRHKEPLQRQLNIYAEMFKEAFETVTTFIGENIGMYRWYSPKICNIIMNAWVTSTDLSEKRSIISAADVFNMPVWLSEQLTDYVTSLPCTYTTQPDPVFILDAMEAMLKQSNDSKRYNADCVYSLCIPKSYMKSFLDKLSMFYWDVKEGRFVSQLRVKAGLYYNNCTDGTALSPEQYDEELRARGFPLDQDAEEGYE